MKTQPPDSSVLSAGFGAESDHVVATGTGVNYHIMLLISADYLIVDSFQTDLSKQAGQFYSLYSYILIQSHTEIFMNEKQHHG